MTSLASISVLVASCSAYSDLWPPFFTLFFRYWDDCPYPIYLLTETGSYEHERVHPIVTGGDGSARTWSTRLRHGLSQLDTDFVILMQEDYLLDRRVETTRIQSIAQYASHCVQHASDYSRFPVRIPLGQSGMNWGR